MIANMNQMKRKIDDTVDENNNKKTKFSDENNRSVFEDLPNEIIYEIFEYLDVYHIYYGFYYLNNRLRNFLLNSNIPIQIHIPHMSKSNFENYTKDMIIPNRFRINSLHLSLNPFTFDLIFSPSRFICQFIVKNSNLVLTSLT